MWKLRADSSIDDNAIHDMKYALQQTDNGTGNGTGTGTGGFVLLEVLLAIALFGIAGIGLVKALNFSAKAAVESQLDIRMMMRLQSALTLASKAQQMEEYEVVSDPDELGVQVMTIVEEMRRGNVDE